MWTSILDLVGWQGAAVLASAHILHKLEILIRQGRHEVVPRVVKRGHRTLDEPNAVRDASTPDYRVIMVADLNVGGNRETRSSTFTAVYRSFGDIRASDEVAELLTRPRGHEV